MPRLDRTDGLQVKCDIVSHLWNLGAVRPNCWQYDGGFDGWAEALGHGRSTIRRAMKELQAAGVVFKYGGEGKSPASWGLTVDGFGLFCVWLLVSANASFAVVDSPDGIRIVVRNLSGMLRSASQLANEENK
jgi:hypothetical protein